MEAIVALMMCILIFRIASLPQFNLTHYLFLNGFKLILIPPATLIDQMIQILQLQAKNKGKKPNKKSIKNSSKKGNEGTGDKGM